MLLAPGVNFGTTMGSFLVMAIFAVVLSAESLGGGSAAAAGEGGHGPALSFAQWLLALGPFGALIVVQQIVGVISEKQLEATGSWRAVLRLDNTNMVCRWVGLALHAWGVLGLGTLSGVRAAIGDVVVIDEVLVTLPPLVVMASAWWATYPIDVRLREAGLIGVLDRGATYHPPAGRVRFVFMQFRHQVLLVAVPVLSAVCVSEIATIVMRKLVNLHRAGEGAAWVRSVGSWLEQPGAAQWTHTGVQALTVVLIVLLLPIAVRYIWDTVPLREGTTAEALLRMCKQSGVKVRDILLWRTDGTSLNGAVIGVVGRARHILLTDALLEMLPLDQVRAVLAHEIAHVKLRHIPWLALVAFSTLALLSVIGEFALLTLKLSADDPVSVIELSLVTVMLGTTALVFGFVSRRFEWQADAYAAKMLSEPDPAEPTPADGVFDRPAGLVHTRAVSAMIGALDMVSKLNHIPLSRFSFRHGSMRRRMENLVLIELQSVDSLPIDRVCNRIKRAGLVVLAVSVVLWVIRLSIGA